MIKSKFFEYLVDAFKALPGVGQKTAKKYAYYIINEDMIFVNKFAQRLLDAKQNLKRCNICNCICEDTICNICNHQQFQKSLCVVLNDEDFEHIVNSKIYQGYYYILLDNEDSEKKVNLDKIDIQKIITAINTHKINEIIIATNFSLKGEIIANFIKSKLQHLDINIFRIGFGVPLNANIDYIDEETIKESFKNKRRLY